MAEKNGAPEPGWSDRVNDPEIAAAIAKNRKAAFKWGCVTVLIALVAPTVVSKFAPDAIKPEHAIQTGLVIAGAIIVCSILCKIVRAFRKPYEAVVTDKIIEKSLHRDRNESSSDRVHYITVVRTTDGRKKKITETGFRPFVWNYMSVGDRFRYHPQFDFPYELYDKPKAGNLRCVVCSKENPLEADRCSRCHAPLLK